MAVDAGRAASPKPPADGLFRRCGTTIRERYTTKSRRLAEDFVRLAFHCGKRARISGHDSGAWRVAFYDRARGVRPELKAEHGTPKLRWTHGVSGNRRFPYGACWTRSASRTGSGRAFTATWGLAWRSSTTSRLPTVWRPSGRSSCARSSGLSGERRARRGSGHGRRALRAARARARRRGRTRLRAAIVSRDARRHPHRLRRALSRKCCPTKRRTTRCWATTDS